eukprot:1730975-Prymnesium_polylepis.1
MGRAVRELRRWRRLWRLWRLWGHRQHRLTQLACLSGVRCNGARRPPSLACTQLLARGAAPST